MSSRPHVRDHVRSVIHGDVGFTPLDLPGLVHWYDFSDPSAITLGSGRITAMTAKGTANSLTVDGTGPTWSDGDGYAVASGSGLLQFATALTSYPLVVILSIRTPDPADTGNIFASSSSSDSNHWLRLAVGASGGVNAQARQGALKGTALDVLGAAAANTNMVALASFGSTAVRRARRNGSAYGTPETTSVTHTLDYSSLLAVNSAGSKFYTLAGTRIYDAIILNAEPSEADYARLLTFLQSRHS